MTDYHYSELLVWDNLGGYVRPATKVRSLSVVNPLDGLIPTLTQGGVTVTYLTADENGRVTFTATVDVVRADFGDGPAIMYSDERLTATSDAAPALAAAQTAQAAVDEITTGDLGLLVIDATKIPDSFVKLSGSQIVEGWKDFTTQPTVNGVPVGGGNGNVFLDTDGVPYFTTGATADPPPPIVLPPPPASTIDLPVQTSPLRTVNVTNRAGLDAAIADVQWGDKIVLAAGNYGSGVNLVFRSPASTAGYTPSNPVPGVWIKGAAALGSIVNRGAVTSGYALHLDKANYMVVDGLQVVGGQKGVMADETSYARLINCDIGTMGHEAVHWRNYSSFNVTDSCTIHHTGEDNEAYGEGWYAGQSVNNWDASFSRTGGAMDTSNYNVLQSCTLYEIAAECVDAKEGTKGGLVKDNTMSGKAISGVNSADSYVDIKGNEYLVEGNVCTVPSAKLVHGMSTHILYAGFGSNNVFMDNSVVCGGQTTGAENSANGGAQGYNIQTSGSRGSATGNVVGGSNTATNNPGGLSNI